MMEAVSSDNEPTWTARYYRRAEVGTERYDSLIDAVRYLWVSQEYGLLAPDAIIGPDGIESYRFGHKDGQVSIEDLYERLTAEEIENEAEEP